MDEKSRKRKRWLILFPILGMIAGILLLTYPFAMDQYNEYRNEQAISSMSSVYDRYEDYQEELELQLVNAQAYNAKLAGVLSESEVVPDYEEQLTFDGGGVMGYLEIPKIHVKMILYHGTSDETLAVGAGHLEGSSLPVGGASTHTVITAHSGMKIMRAFDDIRELEAGDRILLTTLGKQLIYEVENSETVLPYETESLAIIPGEDRLTLITCTPYGINDHRLLVHAVRAQETEVQTTVVRGNEPETVNTLNVSTITELPEDSREETIARFRFDRRTIPVMIAILICFGAMVYLIIRTTGRRKGK